MVELMAIICTEQALNTICCAVGRLQACKRCALLGLTVKVGLRSLRQRLANRQQVWHSPAGRPIRRLDARGYGAPTVSAASCSRGVYSRQSGPACMFMHCCPATTTHGSAAESGALLAADRVRSRPSGLRA